MEFTFPDMLELKPDDQKTPGELAMEQMYRDLWETRERVKEEERAKPTYQVLLYKYYIGFGVEEPVHVLGASMDYETAKAFKDAVQTWFPNRRLTISNTALDSSLLDISRMLAGQVHYPVSYPIPLTPSNNFVIQVSKNRNGDEKNII